MASLSLSCEILLTHLQIFYDFKENKKKYSVCFPSDIFDNLFDCFTDKAVGISKLKIISNKRCFNHLHIEKYYLTLYINLFAFQF